MTGLTVASCPKEDGDFDEGTLIVETVRVILQNVAVYTWSPVEVRVCRPPRKRRCDIGVLDRFDVFTAQTTHLVLVICAAHLSQRLVELVLELRNTRLRGKEDRLGHGADEELVVASAVSCEVEGDRPCSG